MKKVIIVLIALAGILLALIAVGLKSGALHSHYPYFAFLEDHTDHDDHDHDGHDHGPETKKKDAEDEDEDAPVHLSPEQLKLIGVAVTEAAEGVVGRELRLPGGLMLNPEETARIMPHMPGFVTAVPVKEGDKVEPGQLLARMTSHKLGEYYAGYHSALELEKLALAEFEREGNLKKGNATSEKEFLRTQREYADARIARQRAETLLRSLLLNPDRPHDGHDTPDFGNSEVCTLYEIRSPLKGVVISKDIYLGENFSEDNERTVFVVSNLETLLFDLQAGAETLSLLKPGMKVAIENAGKAGLHSGVVTYVSPLIDANTRTGIARVTVDNRDGLLRAGEFATGIIRISPEGAKPKVTVPREAIQLIDGETVVFVPHGDGFDVQVVKTGRSDKGSTEILAGLAAGEKYVSAGAFELKSVLLTSGMDPHAGHGH